MGEERTPYTVRIRCNATGKVRTYSDEWLCEPTKYDEDWRTGLEFHWTDGNGGCDCNRGRFFAIAGGEEPPELDCWPEGRFTVLDATFPDGEVIPIDVEAKA